MSFRTGFYVIMIGMMPLLACGAGHTENFPDSAKLPARIDTDFIADYRENLTARMFLLFQNASLMLNPQNSDKIIYRPNVNVRAGLAGNWRWFGLSLSIDNPFYKTDQEKYGRTSSIDIRVTALGRNLAAEVFLQHYTGFYIGYPDKPDGTKYILPDMTTFSIGVAGLWIYNSRRFSMRAASLQNEQQRKSAGSLIVRPALLYYHISSDDGIIPAALILENNIPLSDQIVSGDFYSLGLSPGYAYTFVFLKNLYVTGAVFPGVAAQIHSYFSATDRYSGYEFSFQLNGSLTMGYNSDKWFIGASVQSGFNEVPDKLNNSMFNYDIAQFKLWGGTRFNIFKSKKNTIFVH